MPQDAHLLYADRVGRHYSRLYGISPVAGRLFGYLAVCDPMHQTIAELADALLVSRSAINGAVKLLEGLHLIDRTRRAGERVDRIAIDASGMERNGFDASEYEGQAALAREGLALLEDAPADRRVALEEIAALADLLAERMPELLEEWHQRRDALRAARKKESRP